jgi:hypothetical protein
MDFPKSTQELLEKYWAAETTPEEEIALRKLLQDRKGDNVYGTYFHLLTQESEVKMQAPLKPVNRSKVISLRQAISIAASVIVLITAGVVIQRTMTSMSTDSMANTDSFEDPEKAYEEARTALILVSQKMQKSRKLAGDQLAKTQPYLDIIK